METGQVFVPEHGTWTIWASNDPLLATPILRVETWNEPTAYDEVWGKERDATQERPFEKLPNWLVEAVGVVATPAAASGAPLRIDHLEPEGEVVDPAAELRAVWDISESRLRVGGTVSGDRVSSVLIAPDVAPELVWKQLLESEGLWPQWDSKAMALRVPFDGVNASERESLLRAVEFRRPAVAGLGPFDGTTVEGVALRAASVNDANRWAEWRLQARIRDYATAERFEAWTAEAIRPLAEFQPHTPSRKSLAQAAWRSRSERPTPVAWHLVAAEDWGL
jgi:hypothetical protein